jgi:hypothetical protein
MNTILQNKLKQFLITENWLDKNVPEQARAIFTTICIINEWECDTVQTGLLLMELYEQADIESVDISYEEFENFMYELIV